MPDALSEVAKTSVLRDGRVYVIEVRVPGKGVQVVQGLTIRAALLAAADVVSALTGEA